MIVFLAAPFTDKIDINTGQIEELFTNRLTNLINCLRHAGHEVICAHEREKWGKALDRPDVALDLDLQGIRNAHVMIAILGNPPSPGVQMELGAALICKTPIVCLYEQGSFIPYLVKGMDRLTNTVYIEYTDLEERYADILSRLDGLVKPYS